MSVCIIRLLPNLYLNLKAAIRLLLAKLLANNKVCEYSNLR